MTSPAGRTTAPDRRVDARAVTMFVVLDQLSYMLVYWLVYPSFAEVLAVVPEATVTAVHWVISALRLVFVALITVRALRSRRGLASRSHAVPTMLLAAVVAWALHLVLGLVARFATDLSGWSWWMLLDLATWVAFALLALLFVSPGEADRLPLRYRQALSGDRGATNLLLVPAAAGLVAAALLVIAVLGSATDTARESRTAADAAALAATEAWRDRVEHAFGVGVGASDAEDFWDFAGTDLEAMSSWRVADAAHRYAQANGAEVLRVEVDAAQAQVTVWVRNRDAVHGTGDRVESVATAELQFRSGVCRSGRTLGYLVWGSCRTTAPPPPTPTPTPTPEDDEDEDPPPPPPPPFAPPTGLGPFDVDVALTTAR